MIRLVLYVTKNATCLGGFEENHVIQQTTNQVDSHYSQQSTVASKNLLLLNSSEFNMQSTNR
jgi:hypothetical protein